MHHVVCWGLATLRFFLTVGVTRPYTTNRCWTRLLQSGALKPRLKTAISFSYLTPPCSTLVLCHYFTSSSISTRQRSCRQVPLQKLVRKRCTSSSFRRRSSVTSRHLVYRMLKGRFPRSSSFRSTKISAWRWRTQSWWFRRSGLATQLVARPGKSSFRSKQFCMESN